MMWISYSDHALMRLHGRGLLREHVDYLLVHPKSVRPARKGRLEVIGMVENLTLSVIIEKREDYIRVVTVIV